MKYLQMLLAALEAKIIMLEAEKDALERLITIRVGDDYVKSRLAVVCSMLSVAKCKREALRLRYT